MEYCLGDGFELFSDSIVTAVGQDSNVIHARKLRVFLNGKIRCYDNILCHIKGHNLFTNLITGASTKNEL